MNPSARLPSAEPQASMLYRLRLPLLAAALAASMMSACGEKGDSPQADKGGDRAAAPGSSDVPRFARFPEASNLIIGIDVAALTASPLWQRVGPQLAERIDALAAIETACGFDPLAKIQSLVIGGDMTSDDNGILSIKGITRADMAKCQGTEDDQAGALSKHTLGDTTLWIAWVGDDELLISRKAEMAAGESAADLAVGKKWLADRAAGKGGLDQNAAAMALLGKVDSEADAWFVALPNEALPMTVSGHQAQGAVGTVTVSDGLALSVDLRMESADVATDVATKAKSVLSMLEKHPKYGELVKALAFSIDASETTVSLEASFSAESLDAVTDQAKNLAPAIFGAGHLASEK